MGVVAADSAALSVPLAAASCAPVWSSNCLTSNSSTSSNSTLRVPLPSPLRMDLDVDPSVVSVSDIEPHVQLNDIDHDTRLPEMHSLLSAGYLEAKENRASPTSDVLRALPHRKEYSIQTSGDSRSVLPSLDQERALLLHSLALSGFLSCARVVASVDFEDYLWREFVAPRQRMYSEWIGCTIEQETGLIQVLDMSKGDDHHLFSESSQVCHQPSENKWAIFLTLFHFFHFFFWNFSVLLATLRLGLVSSCSMIQYFFSFNSLFLFGSIASFLKPLPFRSLLSEHVDLERRDSLTTDDPLLSSDTNIVLLPAHDESDLAHPLDPVPESSLFRFLSPFLTPPSFVISSPFPSHVFASVFSFDKFLVFESTIHG